MSDDKKIEITDTHKQEAAESLKTVPYARLLGFELVDLSANEAKIKLRMRDELRQPYGILHGGATASLIDTAMAFAVRTCVAEDVPTTTIDLTVSGTLALHFENLFLFNFHSAKFCEILQPKLCENLSELQTKPHRLAV